MTYAEFFCHATGHDPYAYQIGLLRVHIKCADAARLDPEGEGCSDNDTACSYLRF